jgi:outer membrane protein insertion porin family/translocation and assembly module TamA
MRSPGTGGYSLLMGPLVRGILIGSTPALSAALPLVSKAQDTARALAPALAPAPAPAPTGPARPDPQAARRNRPEITAVTIQGARAISKSDLEASIVTTASGCRSLLLEPFCWVSRSPYLYLRHYLDRVELRRDILRIRIQYWKLGYRLASVDTTVTPPGSTKVKVLFSIHEGPPTLVTAIGVTPESLFSARRLAGTLRPRVGQPLNLNSLDSTVVHLRQRLWDRGYSDATIDTAVVLTGQPPDDAMDRRAAAAGRLPAGTAAVNLLAHRQPRTTVDTVVVTGNRNINARIIGRTVFIEPHKVFYRGDVDRSQRALYQTNLFRSTQITAAPTPGMPDSAKTITVSVDEIPSRVTEAGVGFSTIDFFSVTGRFTNYNLLGGGRRLTLQASVGNLFAPALYPAFNNGFKLIPPDVSLEPYLSPTWSANADFTQPWVFARGNSAGAGIFDYRRIAPGVFIDNGYGATATFTHELADRASVSLGYRFAVSHVQASDVYFCVNYGVCDMATRDAIQQQTRLSPLILTAQISRSNDPLDATHGYVATAELQFASTATASDFQYARGFVNGSYYQPIGRSVLAFNARLGAVGALPGVRVSVGDTSGKVLYPTVRFYAGGAQSVRGFGENLLGPHVLTIAPEVLRGMHVSSNKRDTTYQCPLATPISLCPVNVPYISDADFSVQPLGGRTLLEGSVEYRYPITRNLQGVLFVDAGVVGQSDIAHATSGTSAVTPGIGVRYGSVVGPIRLDVGYNPLSSEHLPVQTEDINGRIVTVTGPTGQPENGLRLYQATTGGFLSRLAFHLSIGQAF